MREIDRKVLAKLMRNSRLSDRELAKQIGSSQPTVTRARNKLEKQGYIREYTVLPNFKQLGYEIMAITVFRYKKRFDTEKIEKAKKILNETFEKGPFEIILAERGMGCGFNAVMISVHKDYNSLMQLTNWALQFYELELGEIENFVVDLIDKVRYRPLTFSSLAKHVLTEAEKKE